MIINVKLDGENAWPDLRDRLEDVIHLQGPPMEIAVLPDGMASGKPSVAIRIDLPDGRVVVAEISLALWQMAAAAIRGRYGDRA